MPWKRCEGCTRAISTEALTCEYCGRACGDNPASPPPTVGDPETFDWPLDDQQSSSTTSDTAGESPQGLPVLELDSSFPFTDVGDEPLHGVPAPESAAAETETFLLEDELSDEAALVMSDAAASHATGPAAVAASAAPGAASAAKKTVGPRQLVMLGGALVAASALIFTILSMRPSASPEPVDGAGAPAPARRPAANRARSGASTASVAATTAPKWTRVVGGRWTGGDKKAVAFELPANHRIQIWTRDVTPLLIVRCQGGQVEPFVYTQSAARMEPQDGDHTVRVAFDDAPEVTERWPDSDEHDALFAKDGAAFARQLAAAGTLRFGFEPHNAPPASAHFDVAGLGELLAAAAKPCGWQTVPNR